MRESDLKKYREETYKKYTTPDASGNLPRLKSAGLIAMMDPHPLGMANAVRIAQERRRIQGQQASRSAVRQAAQQRMERAEQSAMSLERAAAYRRQAGFGSSQVSAGSGVGMRLS